MKKFFFLLSLCAATVAASAQQVLDVEAEIYTTPATTDVNPGDDQVGQYAYAVVNIDDLGTDNLDEAVVVVGENLDELLAAHPVETTDAYWYGYWGQYVFEFNTQLIDGGYKFFIITYGEGEDRLYRVGTRKLYVWDDEDTEAELNIDDEVHDFSEWLPAPAHVNPTAISQLNAAQPQAVKAMVNGQLILKAGARQYNAMGIVE